MRDKLPTRGPKRREWGEMHARSLTLPTQPPLTFAERDIRLAPARPDPRLVDVEGDPGIAPDPDLGGRILASSHAQRASDCSWVRSARTLMISRP